MPRPPPERRAAKIGEALEAVESQRVRRAVGGIVGARVRLVDVDREPGLERVAPAPAPVHVDRERVPEAAGVLVHQVPGAVGGVVEEAILVAHRERRAGFLVQARLHMARGRGVAEFVVEVEDAVGLVPPQGEGVGERAGPARERSLPAPRAVAPSLERNVPTGSAASPAREDLDDAAHRVGAVERGRRAPHDLDALHVVGGERGEVEGPARLVHAHAVDQDLHVVRLASPQKERGDGAERAAPRQRRARNLAQGVGHVFDAGPFQLGPVEDGRVGGRGPFGLRQPVGGDHQPLQVGRSLGGNGQDRASHGDGNGAKARSGRGSKRCGRGGKTCGRAGNAGGSSTAHVGSPLPRGRKRRCHRTRARFGRRPSPPRGGAEKGRRTGSSPGLRPPGSPSRACLQSPVAYSSRSSPGKPGPHHSGGAAPDSHRLPWAPPASARARF